jgi:hypothetical protein
MRLRCCCVLVEEDAGNLAAVEDAPASWVFAVARGLVPHLRRRPVGVVNLDGGGVVDLDGGGSRGTERGEQGTERGAGERSVEWGSSDDGEVPPGMAAAAIAMERSRT